MSFDDRAHAGRELAQALLAWRGRPEVLVLALPRGGVPVAAPIADALGAPLDVLVVRKLGHPAHAEFAVGAIGAGGVRVVTQANASGVDPMALEAVVRREAAELARREALYRPGCAPLALGGRCVILVDDGLATGATMRAAIEVARAAGAARIVVAAPVAARAAVDDLRTLASEVVVLRTPEPFRAVGQGYRDFEQTTDDEVRDLLLARGGAARR